MPCFLGEDDVELRLGTVLVWIRQSTNHSIRTLGIIKSKPVPVRLVVHPMSSHIQFEEHKFISVLACP